MAPTRSVMKLNDLLDALRLGKFAEELVTMGVESIHDLLYMNDGDLAGLGMPLIQRTARQTRWSRTPPMPSPLHLPPQLGPSQEVRSRTCSRIPKSQPPGPTPGPSPDTAADFPSLIKPKWWIASTSPSRPCSENSSAWLLEWRSSRPRTAPSLSRTTCCRHHFAAVQSPMHAPWAHVPWTPSCRSESAGTSTCSPACRPA